LNALNLLRECAVVAINREGFEGATICCAYVPEPEGEVSPAHLRKRLTTSLPAYMLPARWLEFLELPKNANGKIDRKELMQQFTATETEV
ncbi:MAG: D-alanine--poly(phosphoribitol) ligase, partial [Bacteroidetes bacterium]|nr:D-alanine--poly(phosphoribitol) ligase [Bacteroidota bacterium]